MDLSSPSVNDGVSRKDYTFHYTSISEAVTRVLLLG